MKIEIEIGDNHVKILTHWASLCRTLTTAENLLNEITAQMAMHPILSLPIPEAMEEQMNHCSLELEQIKVPMDMLHQAFKEAIRKRKYENDQAGSDLQRKEKN